MIEYEYWEARHPQAALELKQILGAMPWPANDKTDGKSEAWAQQQARFNISKAGAMAWRNNNGATPTKVPACCPSCGLHFTIKQPPIRYGLANDSQKLNKKIKSSDLILEIPRIITPQMVGTTIAQFGAVECKRPGWAFSGSDEEIAQLAWLQLTASLGGYATFSTGEVTL
jgi:hypothetical protein